MRTRGYGPELACRVKLLENAILQVLVGQSRQKKHSTFGNIRIFFLKTRKEQKRHQLIISGAESFHSALDF